MSRDSTTFDKLARLRLIPVIVIERAEHAEPLLNALISGGLPCAEVTFRTPAAAEALRVMAATSGVVVGAGTVLTIDQVKQAVDCGAQFLVAPGFSPKVVGYCVEHGVPIAPGVSNPTDIEMALEFGLDVLKFFPAEALGGLSTLNAISAPYGPLRFIASGGITTDNLPSYLRSSNVLACGGSWMVRPELIAADNFDEVTRLVQQAVTLAQGSSRP
jgi:2-dehydro-3-deoxyphosphogluconate aldolase/(4S)-4-hydroxy-2-oxoglutarate aldolase